MSTTLKILWLCLFLAVGLWLTAYFLRDRNNLAKQDQEILKTVSPDGEFSVDVRRTLKVNPERPNVIAAIAKDQNSFIDQIVLYPEGAFDTDLKYSTPIIDGRTIKRFG